MKTLSSTLAFLALNATLLTAEVSLPHIFGDHMVLQRNQENPVWGKADAGESIKVTFDGRRYKTVAGDDGKWRVRLDPHEAGGPYKLSVKGSNQIQFTDVLVGEVWISSGQSNMEWNLGNTNHADVEIADSQYPEIRRIRLPHVGTQEAKEDFNGKWELCEPSTVDKFSAVGFLFGRRLHNILGVPIGMIENAWGGSSAEAWVARDVLEQYSLYDSYIKKYDERCEGYTDEDYKREHAEWEAADPDTRPWSHSDPRYDQHRPANLYNGMIHPIVGYGIRGVIWYQGESNGSRPETYAHLMTTLITTWRADWGQGDFPFYWVQIADHTKEKDLPSNPPWAYLREAQTQTLDMVPNSGQAVIIDVGEGRDIHPRDKQTVANRLVRHALAKNYGFDMQADSPRYTSMSVEGNAVILTFSPLSDQGLYAFDVAEPQGFTIAGEDKVFVNAQAEIIGKNQVKVWADAVESPVAVRYAWAMNPVCNLYDRNGLPVTPFRTDDW